MNDPSRHIDGVAKRVTGCFACILASALALSSCIDSPNPNVGPTTDSGIPSDWPAGDPRSGKALFVSKGCVVCHSVNDKGGLAAPPLDAPPDGRRIDPMTFAAAMWAGASAMLSLQYTALGYQIALSGSELRDLAAFASNLETQAAFSLDDIPADIRPWIIDRPYWLEPSWPEPFETLPEGLPTPFQDL